MGSALLQDACGHMEALKNPKPLTIPKLTLPALNYRPSGEAPRALVPSRVSLGHVSSTRGSLRGRRNGPAAVSISLPLGLQSSCRPLAPAAAGHHLAAALSSTRPALPLFLMRYRLA